MAKAMAPQSTTKANVVRKALPSGAPEHVKRRLMGTSADSRAPWETYRAGDPLDGCSEDMRREISEYSKKHHGKTSNANVEQLMRQKEMSKEMVKEYKMYKQDELRDTPARVGRIMHCLDWLKKFETIRPAYLSANIRKGLSGLAVWNPRDVEKDGDIVREDWQYVCGVQVGFMHEFSSMHFDARDLPLNEKWRGWRTVNLRLIQLGLMTEEQENEIFGKATGEAARRHNEQLYAWRNRKRSADDHKDE
jgi:hypothetical protein